MIVDSFYTDIEKHHFYLGRISQVYRGYSSIQVENLSLLSHRKIKNEMLIPNTINYFVVIESIQGLFLGEVYQSRVSSAVNIHNSINEDHQDIVYPEISVDIIGLMKYGDMTFRLPDFLTVGITDKVYLVNKEIINVYIKSIELNHDNDKEQCLSSFANLLNANKQRVDLKASTLFNRHLLTVGSTNSGKSTSALSILDKLLIDNKKVLIIDPTGEYDKAFKEVKKLKLGVDTKISVGELSMEQWCILFDTNTNTQGAVLYEAIHSLRYQHGRKDDDILIKSGKSIKSITENLNRLRDNNKDFDLSLLPNQIIAESVIGDKSGNYYVYDSFKLNNNKYLSDKIKFQLENTSFQKFFDKETGMDLLEEINNFLVSPYASLYINMRNIGF